MRTTRSSADPPDDSGRRHERFARAVDGGVRDSSDHTLERELAVVAALRNAGTGAQPRPSEVDRMRHRVLAGQARVATERRETNVTPLPAARGGRHARRSAATGEARRRVVVAAAAALCLLMSLSGMSLLLSRDALPGEALYAFKRSTESAELGLTFGEQSRALKHLEFATARVDEIETMTAQADANGTWGADGAQFLGTLDDFDADAVAGTRLLTTVATTEDFDILASLLGWAHQQQQRLDSVRGALPMEASTRLAGSLGLLERVQQRAAALEQRLGCLNVSSGAADDLGPVPADEACVRGELDDAASAQPLPGGTRIARPEERTGPLVPGTLLPDRPVTPPPAGGAVSPSPPGPEVALPDEVGDPAGLPRPASPHPGPPPAEAPPPVLPLPLLPGLPEIEGQ